MKHRIASDERGQAMTEYIILAAIIVSIFAATSRALRQMGIEDRVKAPIQLDFARAYRYGHVKAKGFDEGEIYNRDGPNWHPRINGGDNFRVFLNPGPQ